MKEAVLEKDVYKRQIMDAIMASIFVAIISIIGTIPYGWRGVQNG